MSDLYKNLRNLVLSTTGCKVNNHAISLILSWQAASTQGVEDITEAYTQGQIDAGINPSYSTAKAYASARKAPASGEPVAVCACGDEYPNWKCPNCEAAEGDTHPPAKVRDVAPVAEVVSGYSGDPDTRGSLSIKPLDLSGCKIGDKLLPAERPDKKHTPPQEQ